MTTRPPGSRCHDSCQHMQSPRAAASSTEYRSRGLAQRRTEPPRQGQTAAAFTCSRSTIHLAVTILRHTQPHAHPRTLLFPRMEAHLRPRRSVAVGAQRGPASYPTNMTPRDPRDCRPHATAARISRPGTTCANRKRMFGSKVSVSSQDFLPLPRHFGKSVLHSLSDMRFRSRC